MIVSTRRRCRALPIAAAAVAVLAAVGGCADGVAGGEASSSGSATASAGGPAATTETATATDEPDTNDELAAALLPAEAFGPDADVVTVDVRQVSTTASGGLPESGTITPEECRTSLGATQLTPEDFGAIVAQTATTPATVTAQVLAESDRIDGVAPPIDEALARCPEVTVQAPDGSTATVALAEFELPDLGDSSNGLRLTTSVRGPDGAELTVPSLLAVATDGPRMLYLQQTSVTAAPLDEAAFTELFERAFAAQQDR